MGPELAGTGLFWLAALALGLLVHDIKEPHVTDDTDRHHRRTDHATRARPDACPDCRAPLWPMTETDPTDLHAWTCLACGYTPLRLI